MSKNSHPTGDTPDNRKDSKGSIKNTGPKSGSSDNRRPPKGDAGKNER